MPIDERSISLPEQWAKDAQTVIPAPPVPGIAYRNTAITPEQWAHGQDYSRVADSAQWNQMFWTMSGLLKFAEQYGVMPYSPFTDYPEHAFCLGMDGLLYQALQASGPDTAAGPRDPLAENAYWLTLADLLGVRKKCLTTLNLYVRTDGDDANDGLENTPARAKKTVQGAIDEAWNYEGNGYACRIKVANGTYSLTQTLQVGRNFAALGFNSLIIEGESRTGTIFNRTCTDATSFIATGVQVVTVQIQTCTVNFVTTSSGVRVLAAVNYAYLALVDVSLNLSGSGASSSYAFYANYFGHMVLRNCSFAGVAVVCLQATNKGILNLSSTFSASGTVNAVAACDEASLIYAPIPAVSGSITGKRYSVSSNGVINTGGGGVNFFPGTTAGTASTGGQYL